ncbi:hypothetical protein STAS_30975 [Striga asiatica]|uniref:Uncharacterized protein n=1 Tax=Striga asiatica TaxID=4170 RepID=A0A5A7R6Q9_STRAF|nr:hypothetical protein STAS_30975 [Striga asiatica]
MALNVDGESLPKTENENQGSEEPTKINQKSLRKCRRSEDREARRREKKIRGTLLAASFPSYCLRQGIGDLQCFGEKHRSQHRKRLWRLLYKLLLRHSWAEAGGVLSVLLQATAADRSPSVNRAKYSAALELLVKIKDKTVSSRRIQSVYELWMKKLGSLHFNWSTIISQEKFAVGCEFTLNCLQRGNIEDAYQTALCAMQEKCFDGHPLANLVVGLTFYELWYSDVPKELQMTKVDSSGTYVYPEVPGDGIGMRMDFSKGNDALEAEESNSGSQCDLNTSVAFDKVVENSESQQIGPMDIDDNVKKETSYASSQSCKSGMESAKAGGDSEHSLSHYSGDLPSVSIFYTRDLPPWLLPIKLQSSHENLEDALYTHRKLHNNHYKSALKHLHVALNSTPPVVEALHPRIQMLLLGDQVQEAIDELETLSHSSDSVLLLRLKASILEHFDSGNFVKIYTCYEDILKKDPACSDSLARLILMHSGGDYDTQSLVEMIALHLEATYGSCDTWRELASCFLRLSQCQEDRISTCGVSSDGHVQGRLGHSNTNPELFTHGESGKTWRFRAKWWLSRHFNDRILMSDISSGDLKLLTFKAAVASHIYGRHFRYVVKASECIEKENEKELYSLLQMNILNSVGFYSAARNI